MRKFTKAILLSAILVVAGAVAPSLYAETAPAPSQSGSTNNRGIMDRGEQGTTDNGHRGMMGSNGEQGGMMGGSNGMMGMMNMMTQMSKMMETCNTMMQNHMDQDGKESKGQK